MGEAFTRGALRVTSRELLRNDFSLARAEERPSQPIEFVPDEGRTPNDLIGTTYATLKLVSDRFREVLTRFTGWTTYPIRIVLADGSELKGYAGLAVTGRCGPIDDRLSEEVLLSPPVPEGRAVPGLRGLCFDPNSWDGSDIFAAEGYAGVFVVQAVREALEDASVTNADFRRLSEIERIWRVDKGVIETD